MSILVPSDFVGKLAIAQDDPTTAKLQLYIDELEIQYLDDLLGCELSGLLIADLAAPVAGEPTAARFVDIYNKFCIDISGLVFTYPWYSEFYEDFVQHRQNKSRGIKEMLKGFIYAEFVRDQPISNSSIGMSESKGVASNVIGSSNNGLVFKFNDSVTDYWNIQYFINQDLTTYPEFNGIRKQLASII